MHQLAFCLLPVLLAVASAQTSTGTTGTTNTAASLFSPLQSLLYFRGGEMRQCLPLIMGSSTQAGGLTSSPNLYTLSALSGNDRLRRCVRLMMRLRLYSSLGSSAGGNNPLALFAATRMDGIPKRCLPFLISNSQGGGAAGSFASVLQNPFFLLSGEGGEFLKCLPFMSGALGGTTGTTQQQGSTTGTTSTGMMPGGLFSNPLIASLFLGN